MCFDEYNDEAMKLTIKSPVKSNTAASCMTNYNQIGGITSDSKTHGNIPETSFYASSLVIKRRIRTCPREASPVYNPSNISFSSSCPRCF